MSLREESNQISSAFCTVPEALDELRAGRFVIVLDDEDRENEGDLIMPAELATTRR